MFPPEGAAAEDVPLIQRIARWLDWWCTPRWRALLTWVGLALLIGVAADYYRLPGYVDNFLSWLWPRVGHLIGIGVPGWFESAAEGANLYVLMVWMEPFALRLNLWRGVAWVVLRTGSFALGNFALGDYSPPDFIAVALLLMGVLPVGALYRWRSRPWMALMGGGLAVGWFVLLDQMDVMRHGMRLLGIAVIPYAVALLYGTRLLRPEERASRDSGRDRPPA